MPSRSRATSAALLAVAVVAGALVAPVAAAPSPFAGYEIRRVGGRGGGEVKVRIEARADGDPGLYVHAELRPTRTGHDVRGFGVVQYDAPGTETRTYGSVEAEPCATVPLCVPTSDSVTITSLRTFRPARGDRIFVVGVRGQVTVTTPTPGWVVRPTSLGFRVVTADRADATGAYVAGAHVEHFRAATAPGGAHGSIAFADVPCDAGSAALTSDAGDRRTFGCAGGLGMGAQETARGRRWTVEGDTYGSHPLPFRLVVLDFPG